MSMIIMTIRSEMKVSNLGLNHEEPQRFVTSQWGYPRFYFLWRVFWALFHLTWLLVSFVLTKETVTSSSPGVALWFIYLSNWTYLLLTISTVLDAVIVLYVNVKRTDIRKGLSTNLPWYLKVSWLLFSIITEGSLHITGFYWIFIFKDQKLTVLRFIFHGMNSIYVLANLVVTAMPVRVYHVIYPIIYGVIYTVFSVVFHILGGTNAKGDPFIYKVLDWSKWKRTLPLVCLSTFVALPCLYMLVYGIYMLRLFIHSKLQRPKEKDSILESSPERTSSDLE